MKPLDYIGLIWRRLWVIVLTTIITTAIVLFGTLQASAVYTSTALLRVQPTGLDSVNVGQYQIDKVATSFANVARTQPVINTVKDNLELSSLPEYTVESVPATDLLQVSVSASDPELAAEVANEIALALVNEGQKAYSSSARQAQERLNEEVGKIEIILDELNAERTQVILQVPIDEKRLNELQREIETQQQVYEALIRSSTSARVSELVESQLAIVNFAAPPIQPSGPNSTVNMLLGAAVGLLGGIILALIFETLDNRLYTEKDIMGRVNNYEVVGRIPRIGRKQSRILLESGQRESEAFRLLRSQIISKSDSSQVGSLMVMSSLPDEGKSVLTANLAVTFAHAGQTVVLIDADMRRPSLHEFFGMSNTVGLSNYLKGEVTRQEIVQDTSISNLQVILSGPAPEQPAELLSSAASSQLLNDLSGTVDVVLIDTPAYVLVADASLLLPKVNAGLLVVRRKHIGATSLEYVIDQIARNELEWLGVVITDAEPTYTRGYRDYYHLKSAAT